jgi:dTDP-4-amino-4,6-dideoxygalactose transaminase
MDKSTFAPTLDMVQAALEQPPVDGGPAIAGMLWVHIGGVISPEFPAVVEYCRGRGLFVLEDAAHAHGSELNGTKAGALADGGAFSFFPTKVMTTGEGGMITTNSDEADMLARSLRNQGKRGANFGGLHHDLGNSWRITEFGAVQGRIHLRKLSHMIARRQAVYDIVTRYLDEAKIDYVSTAHMNTASQYKLIVLLPTGCDEPQVKQALAVDDVILGGTVYELPCHRQPVFQGICAHERYPTADRWCPNHICPPITSGMTADEAHKVGKSLVAHLRT